MDEFKLELQTETLNSGPNPWFLSHVTLNFTDDLEKQYTILSFVCHFKAIDKFNLESQSRNAQLFCVISITNKLGIDSFDAIAVIKIGENSPMKRRAAASE